MLLRKSRPKRKLLQQKPELVRRFVRIVMLRHSLALGRAFARRISRWRMLGTERKRMRASIGAIEACAREALRARRNGLQASETVFNLALFFLIAERDIQTVKVDALTHPDSWTRSLCERVILLTIHELELDKAGGNRLRQALDDTHASPELRQEVTAALRTVRAAQQKAQSQFADLRHSTIAHRDADAITQYRRIEELDSLAVIQTAAEFYAGTHAFMEVMPKLLAHVGGMGGLVSQLIAQGKRP
jgi:hypothetical protein